MNSAFIINRILRCQYHKGIGEHVAFAVDGHLLLLHGFEQRRLGFGGRSVDLVSEQDVGKNGTLAQRELAGGNVEDLRARNVTGHKIGGELDASKVGVDQSCQGFGEQGFGCAGHAFERHMPASKKCHRSLLKDRVLTDNHFGGFLPHCLIEFFKRHCGSKLRVAGGRWHFFTLHAPRTTFHVLPFHFLKN